MRNASLFPIQTKTSNFAPSQIQRPIRFGCLLLFQQFPLNNSLRAGEKEQQVVLFSSVLSFAFSFSSTADLLLVSWLAQRARRARTHLFPLCLPEPPTRATAANLLLLMPPDNYNNASQPAEPAEQAGHQRMGASWKWYLSTATTQNPSSFETRKTVKQQQQQQQQLGKLANKIKTNPKARCTNKSQSSWPA